MRLKAADGRVRVKPQPKWKASDPKVGFYGCAGGEVARVVRVGMRGAGKAPAAARVDCPVCGRRHLARFMWRPIGELATDAERSPELLVDPKPGRGVEGAGGGSIDVGAMI